MLILIRRVGEVIKIGDDITVTVLTTKGNQARIGVIAPPDKPVDRMEVRLRKEGDGTLPKHSRH